MTNLSGQRILVVEDYWHLGVALKSLLRSVGAEVAARWQPPLRPNG